MKFHRLFIITVLIGHLFLLTGSQPAYANYNQGKITLISKATNGIQGNENSWMPSISADGRFVAFVSSANNLVDEDTNGVMDVFVHDRETGQTNRVSVASDGTQGNGTSWEPSISGDGRLVAFRSEATNLVNDDTNNEDDIFVHDLQSGETIRVSISSNGSEGNGSSVSPAISDNGRYVAFESWASNLVFGDTNFFCSGFNCNDIFVHDLETRQTRRVSIATNGMEGNSSSSTPSISADGRYVAFDSSSSNFVDGDTNRDFDVFVHDQMTGKTVHVSATWQGVFPDFAVLNPKISANGRFVVFASQATNLVSDDTNFSCDHTGDRVFEENCVDIFLHDRDFDNDGIFDESGSVKTIRVSVASDGTQGNGASYLPSISADGRYIAFVSEASNLVSGDTNNCSIYIHPRSCPDVFVYDRLSGQTIRISLAPDGTESNNFSRYPSLSRDGRFIAFDSVATNLVKNDMTAYDDIFVYDCRVTNDPGVIPIHLQFRIYLSIVNGGTHGCSY